jgi:hypothetical protein
MSYRRAAVAVLTCVSVALAGCTGGTAPARAEPVDTQPPATGIRCAAIDGTLLTSVLGGSYGAPREIQTGPITVCGYTSPGALGAVTIRVDSSSDAARFAGAKAALVANKQVARVVKGLGDEAFSASLSAGGVTLTTVDARKGAMEILVSSGATLAKEKALVAKLFTALGAQ